MVAVPLPVALGVAEPEGAGVWHGSSVGVDVGVGVAVGVGVPVGVGVGVCEGHDGVVGGSVGSPVGGVVVGPVGGGVVVGPVGGLLGPPLVGGVPGFVGRTGGTPGTAGGRLTEGWGLPGPVGGADGVPVGDIGLPVEPGVPGLSGTDTAPPCMKWSYQDLTRARYACEWL